jgi:putative protein-disulfide isomerase
MQLVYVHDPMCSWCWAFQPIWREVTSRLPTEVGSKRLLGGLAADTETPMPEATRAYVQANWRRIQEVVPGTQFNFEFWNKCAPRRATYPACRAVIAARQQASQFEEPMITAIQHAYYLDARNPSDTETLLALAVELGLDVDSFASSLHSPVTQAVLRQEMDAAQSLGVRGFPTLVFLHAAQAYLLEHDYQDPERILNQVAELQRAIQIQIQNRP